MPLRFQAAVPAAQAGAVAPPPEAPLSRLLGVAWRRHRQERSSHWTAEQLQQHQARALARLRQFAAEHSPFYRRWHAGLADAPLARLPVLDKAMLMANFDALVTDRAIRRVDVETHLQRSAGAGAAGEGGLYLGRYEVLVTSGSTGRRGIFLFGAEEWLQALAAITRPVVWTGRLRPWQRPRSALLASAAPSHYSARIGRALATRWWPTLRLDAALPLAHMVQQLNAWQPQLLALYPSVLRALAEEQLAGRLHIAPRLLATSAERLTDLTRQRAGAAFGTPVFDTYGATEYAPIATECEHGHLHLLEDRALIEIVDDHARPVPPGETGTRVLLTVLDRFVQPLIRYELSDCLRELPGRCRCGRPFRRLQRIEGRVEETLTLTAADGRTVPLHPNLWHDLLENRAPAGWQVLQEADAALSVRLVGPPQAGVLEALQSQLPAWLHAHGLDGVAWQVTWVVAPERGPTGKAALIARRTAALRPPGKPG